LIIRFVCCDFVFAENSQIKSDVIFASTFVTPLMLLFATQRIHQKQLHAVWIIWFIIATLGIWT